MFIIAGHTNRLEHCFFSPATMTLKTRVDIAKSILSRREGVEALAEYYPHVVRPRLGSLTLITLF